MGQAGAQREPSMEEILASIRRIIENNEPGPDGNPIDMTEGLGHDDDDAENAYATDYAEQAEQEVESQPIAANDALGVQSVAQPVSLADVAARARAIPDTFAVAEIMADIDIEKEVLDGASEIDDVAAEELREALMSDEPVEAVAETFVDSGDLGQAEPVAQQSDTGTSEIPGGRNESLAAHQSGGQLVSLHTGEKVAAAFSELDAAIAAGQKRSFDEIAEEMLRPMLTQWLDDNLPTLVERLVREEIERVSRGNQR